MNATAKSSNVTLRIVAEQVHGHWSARFADPSLPDSYGGSDALDAVRRLIENSPHLGITLDDFEPDWDHCSTCRVELVMVCPPGKTCPDCGGTGKYVGLNVVEGCATCGGTGGV